jgi:hypothetical protein
MYNSTKILAVLKFPFYEFNKDTDAVCLHWQATVSFSDRAWLWLGGGGGSMTALSHPD